MNRKIYKIYKKLGTIKGPSSICSLTERQLTFYKLKYPKHVFQEIEADSYNMDLYQRYALTDFTPR